MNASNGVIVRTFNNTSDMEHGTLMPNSMSERVEKLELSLMIFLIVFFVLNAGPVCK